MGLWLKQSTNVTVKIGPFIDDTDGKTAETSLTLTQADIRLSKNSGDIAQKHEATSASTDELGYYDCPLDTTDTNTLGILQLFVHESGALPVFHEYMIVPTNIWDSLFGADKLDVNTAELADIDFGATMKASINTEVDNALNTAIPGSPTANSVNERVKAIDDKLPAGNLGDATEAKEDTIIGYIDTEVAAIKAVTDTLSLAAIADAVHDEVVEGTLTERQIKRILLSTLAGKSAGGGTATLTFQDNADSKARITATVDADGNRTAVTLDAT